MPATGTRPKFTPTLTNISKSSMVATPLPEPAEDIRGAGDGGQTAEDEPSIGHQYADGAEEASSSPTTAKMEVPYAARGRKFSCVCVPSPSPRPHQPPEPMLIRAWIML